jgi:hypothetical protein
MTPSLARRARRLILSLLDASGPGTERGCTECHCRDCLRATPHSCSITRLLDDLRQASKGKP